MVPIDQVNENDATTRTMADAAGGVGPEPAAQGDAATDRGREPVPTVVETDDWEEAGYGYGV